MGQYGFYYDGTKCTGCRTCQIACKDKNDLLPGMFFRHVRTFETSGYPTPGYYHLSSTCNHCAMPACMANCPSGALSKDVDTGIVLQDTEKCIGCESCIKACPYGVPQYDEEKSLMMKCEMCKDLVDDGKNPVCFDACPNRCLKWGELANLEVQYPAAVRDIAILPDSSQTAPSTIMTARESALDSDYRERFV